MYRFIFFFFVASNLFSQSIEDTIAYSVNLEDYVITAQYEPTHYKNVVHKISLIKKETLDKIGAVTLDHALVLSPTIRLSEDPILGTSIRMRGISASNVAILIDGIPVIGRNNGAINISQISLQNVERIEIVEGPLSSIYGNNAAGGVINIITKKSQVSTISANITNQIETIGQRNHMAKLGLQYKGLNVGLHGRYFNYDQFPSDSMRILDRDTLVDGDIVFNTRHPFNPKTQKSYGSYLRYNIDEDNHVIAKYDYNIENVTDFGIIKRPQFNPYAEDQFYKTGRADYSLNYAGKFNKDLFINSQLAYNTFDRIRDDKRFYLDSMTFDQNLQFSDSIRFDQIFGKTNVNYTGFSDWTIGGGYNYTKESGEGDRILNRNSQDSLVASFSETAFFSNIKYNGISNVNLSLVNRYIRHSTYNDAFTSSLLAKITWNEKTSLRASIAQGYRSPNIKELYLEFIDINHNIIGNVNLKPERSIDLQSTITHQLNKSIEFGINGYYTQIKDRITLFQYETLNFQYGNNASYSAYGLQPSFQFNQYGIRINSNFSIGYWSTNLELEDAPEYGRVLDWNSTIALPVPKVGITLFASHRYVGSKPVFSLRNDIVEVNEIEGYYLIDLSASKSFWRDRIKLLIGARNIFDTRFVQLVDGESGVHSGGVRNNISIGRSVFFALNFVFD